MATLIHIFEKAGLGRAPFRFVDYYEKKGGSCEYCGHAITRHYGVRGVDGHTFYVGSECIYKHGEAGLIDAVKAETREIANEKRRAKAAEKAAVKRAEKLVAEAEYRARQDKIDRIVDGKRNDLTYLLQEATRWLTDVLNTYTRSNLCQNLSVEIQTDFRTLASRGYRHSQVLPWLKDYWCRSFGKRQSKAYLEAEEDFDRRVQSTDIIISELSKELCATSVAARAAA
jgi:hypothetical protein